MKIKVEQPVELTKDDIIGVLDTLARTARAEYSRRLYEYGEVYDDYITACCRIYDAIHAINDNFDNDLTIR